MAEGNSQTIEDQDDELVKKLPSIPSSDEVAFYEDNVAPVHERSALSKWVIYFVQTLRMT